MRTTMLTAVAIIAFMETLATAQTGPGDIGRAPPPPSRSSPATMAAPHDCPTGGATLPVPNGGVLATDRAASLSLDRAGRFPVPPGHVSAAGTFGGTARFDVTTAANYRVAVEPGIWIDVVRGGKPIASIAHDRRSGCKTVDFRLIPGRYTLQLSGSRLPSLKVKLTRIG